MQVAPAWLGAQQPGLGGGLASRSAPVAAPLPARRPSRPQAPGATAAAAAPSAGLPAAALGLFAAAGWCRSAAERRGSGRVVVYGRNYEANIKLKKGPAELRKAKITKKHLNKIILCVREGGPDESLNPPLARNIRLALKDNVPRSTINSRIQKFVDDKEVFEEMVLGGYGAGGIAVMVQCTTNSNIRTRTDVREAFKDAGGQIGTEGCVDHLFNKQGVFRFEGMDEESLVSATMEGDMEVEDVVPKEDGSVAVITLPENFHGVAKALDEQGLEPAESDVVFEPLMTADPSEENAYEVKRLLHLLQELDDVQDVHHTAVLPEDLALRFNSYGIPFTYKQCQKVK